MFVIGFSATVTAASASRTAVQSNIKIADGYGYIDIYVDDYGKVEIDAVTMELLDTNLSAFQIQPDSEMYAKMAVFSISITDEPLFTFGVGYKGDVAALARKLVIISAVFIFALLHSAFDGHVMVHVTTRAVSTLGSSIDNRYSLH